jgi:hypothetical protein
VDRFLLKILGVCSPYILWEGLRHEHQGIEANAWETIFKSMRAFGDLEELYFVIEKKEGFPIENVCDKWRVFVEKRFDKEKKIWDMIRDMNGRECRRYAVPKMMFLTLRRAERARGTNHPGPQHRSFNLRYSPRHLPLQLRRCVGSSTELMTVSARTG